MTISAFNQTMTKAVGALNDAEQLQGSMGELVTRRVDDTELSLFANHDPGTSQ